VVDQGADKDEGEQADQERQRPGGQVEQLERAPGAANLLVDVPLAVHQDRIGSASAGGRSST
jgi:hypothetical protein